jgi:hypothetical protein
MNEIPAIYWMIVIGGLSVMFGLILYYVAMLFKETSLTVATTREVVSDSRSLVQNSNKLLEQANEIVDKFNRLYGETFAHIKPIIGNHPRLMGLDGQSKMSKSLNNAIYLSDSEKEIEQKVQLMYTDPKHIHVEDPGNVEGNVVFHYLDIFILFSKL